MAKQAAKRGFQVRCESLEQLCEAAVAKERPALENKFDAVLLKEVVHLVDLNALPNIARLMKPDGKVLIVTRPSACAYPFGPHATASYAAVTPPVDNVVTMLRKHGFRDVTTHEFDFPCEIEKAKWCKMQSSRFWSNLQALSDKEIAEDVEFIQANHE